MALLLVGGLSACVCAAASERASLVKSVNFSTDNWYPLPESDIKRAVSDTALAVLTQRTNLAIKNAPEAVTGDGEIHILISLIGPAETAKATIEINAPQTGSLVATASVSLHNMDYQDIFNAFEHIGTEAANRMVPQVQARLNTALQPRTGSDSELRAIFEKATALKRDAQFAEARDLFLTVAQQDGAQSAGHWPELAADEIRYGLPMFHAKYLLTGGGQFSVDPDHALSNLTEAENLLRQIYAENAGSVARVQEAQAMLDNIHIGRNAMKRARQASSLARLSSLKVYLAEFIMMQGACPGREDFIRMTEELGIDSFELEELGGSEQQREYALSDKSSGLNVALHCNMENFSRPITLETR